MSLMDFIERFVIAHEKLAEANSVIAQAMAVKPLNPPFVSEVGFTGGGPAQYGVSDGTECTAKKDIVARLDTGVEKLDKLADEIVDQLNHTAGWDPYTSPVQKAYKGDKPDILRRELAKFGLDVGSKMTGAQMHELLLEQAKVHAAAPVPPVPPAAVPPVPPVATPPQMTLPGVPVAPSMAPPAAPAAPTGQVYEAPVPDDVTNQLVMVQIHSALGDHEIGMNQVRAALKLICAPGGDAPAKAAGVIQNIGGASRLTDAATGQRLIADTAIVPIFRGLMDVLEGRA